MKKIHIKNNSDSPIKILIDNQQIFIDATNRKVLKPTRIQH